MKKTISVRIGKGSISHNNRKFVAKNVDERRVKDNVILCCESLKETYENLFGEALAEYNAKQKRKDRRIENYLKHIENGKQEKPFYELVFQVGNKDDTPCGTPDAEVAAEILQEYYAEFLERNLHIRVFNAVIHLDEATPHLHVDFVPFATGQSRGLATRNSLNKALEQQGFSAKTNLETPAKQWTDFEKQRLAEVMRKRGIEWEQLGTHNEHLSVLDFKKQERAKEVAVLSERAEYADKLLKHREEMRSQVEEIIDQLDEQFQAKNAQVRQLDTELAETSAALADNQILLKESAEKVAQIKAIDGIETGKTVFGGKLTVAKEDYAKLTDIAKKQIAAEDRESELTAEVARLKKENEAAAERYAALERNARQIYPLRERLRVAENELGSLRAKFQRVMEFVEGLGLAQKLKEFLNPRRGMHR